MNETLRHKYQYRPCIVEGRRAFFHQWIVSNYAISDRTSVFAMVEYADGTVDRVSYSNVQFVDGQDFDGYDWPASSRK